MRRRMPKSRTALTDSACYISLLVPNVLGILRGTCVNSASFMASVWTWMNGTSLETQNLIFRQPKPGSLSLQNSSQAIMMCFCFLRLVARTVEHVTVL